MDRTAWIVVITCVALLFSWPYLMEKMYPAPEPPAEVPQVQSGAEPVATNEIVEGTSIKSSIPSLSPARDVVVDGDLANAQEYVLENEQYSRGAYNLWRWYCSYRAQRSLRRR